MMMMSKTTVWRRLLNYWQPWGRRARERFNRTQGHPASQAIQVKFKPSHSWTAFFPSFLAKYSDGLKRNIFSLYFTSARPCTKKTFWTLKNGEFIQVEHSKGKSKHENCRTRYQLWHKISYVEFLCSGLIFLLDLIFNFLFSLHLTSKHVGWLHHSCCLKKCG